MTGEEIKKEIDNYNKQLAEVVEPIYFVLNEQTDKLLKKIEKLQSLCKHNCKGGVCIYCGIMEEED